MVSKSNHILLLHNWNGFIYYSTDEKIEEGDTNDNFLNGIVPQNDTRETVHSKEMNSSISNYKESTVW